MDMLAHSSRCLACARISNRKAHGATRRRFLLSTSTSMSTFFGHGGTLQANSAEASPQPDGAAQNPFIAGLLERSAANKDKYNKERLDSYYRRNYQDYFNYQKPSLEAGTGGLSKELRAEILEWLKKNDK